MISLDSKNLLNEILPILPINKEFRLSDIIKQTYKNSTIEHVIRNISNEEKLAREIHFFLISQGFAIAKGSWFFLREGVTADIQLTTKGIALKYAKNFENYYASNNKELRFENDEVMKLNAMEKLTSIIAIWTFIAGLFYVIQIANFFIIECYNYRIGLIGIICLIFCVFGVWLLKPFVKLPGKYKL